jgi:hypothetical protein
MKIPLTKGYSAEVDEEDFAFLSQWKWYAQPAGNKVYAMRRDSVQTGGNRMILMHRVVNNTPEHLVTDHIDGDGLNNRKVNLRNATRSQNCMNTQPKSGKASKFKGVFKDTSNGRKKIWVASIMVSGKAIKIGRFECELEAATAYRNAAEKYFGEFSYKRVLL